MVSRATCHHPYLQSSAAWLPSGSCHQALWPSAFAAPGLQPALCLHRQRSSIAACPLPAHSPLLLGHSSLPFASLQTLKTPKTPKTLQPEVWNRATCHHHYSLPFASNCCMASSRQLPPSPLAVSLCCSRVAACPLPAHRLPSFKPSKTPKTIPRGSFHQVPGRQRSSIAACPLPAHSPLLLGHSSLPFASLQTLKTPKTPKTLHRRCGTAPPATTLTIRQLLLHGFLAAAATKPSGRQPLLLQGCSLPFAAPQRSSIAACPCLHKARQLVKFEPAVLLACVILQFRFPGHENYMPSFPAGLSPKQRIPAVQVTNQTAGPFAFLRAPNTRRRLRRLHLSSARALNVRGSFHLAVSVPALQPALCLHIALSC